MEPAAIPLVTVEEIPAISKARAKIVAAWLPIELLEAVSFTDKIIFGRTNYCKEVSLGYPQHKHFYNEKAKQVIDFCEKNKIDSYIKEKTITPDI